MNHRLRGHRRPVALLTGLVLAATISVVAPATAQAAPATTAATGSHHVQPAPAGKQAQSQDWSW